MLSANSIRTTKRSRRHPRTSRTSGKLTSSQHGRAFHPAGHCDDHKTKRINNPEMAKSTRFWRRGSAQSPSPATRQVYFEGSLSEREPTWAQSESVPGGFAGLCDVPEDRRESNTLGDCLSEAFSWSLTGRRRRTA
jgi:hypothetical protein